MPKAKQTDAVSDLLKGRLADGMTSSQRVWALTARVPRGRVATYGQIAAALGIRSARAVGQALNRNPYAPKVPCHRVVASTGALQGFAEGLDRKRQLLQAEGVPFKGDRVDLARCRVAAL